jgi:predicted phosphodiesterase
MFKRAALVSDIHGNLLALEAVVTDIQKRQVDCVINLGDHLSGPLWPYETAQFLMKQNWVQIAGNHDRKLVQQDPKEHSPSDRYAYQFLGEPELAWLRSLPASQVLEDALLLFHGAPGSDTTYLLETVAHGRLELASQAAIRQRLGETKSPILLCGHTHKPRVVQLAGDFLIINPGSVGLPAYDDVTPEYHAVENGSPHARYAIIEEQGGGWKVEFISVVYDHSKAAEQARKNGRPEWAVALLTGFMS